MKEVIYNQIPNSLFIFDFLKIYKESKNKNLKNGKSI